MPEKRSRKPHPDIFAYENYRLFISDYFEWKKNKSKGFSLAVFASQAGFKARDFLLRVMNGSRNLSPDSIDKVAAAMNLHGGKYAYFEALVRLNQSKNQLERDKHLSRLSSISRKGKFQQLRRDQFEYLSEWYHAALRSLLPVTYFKEDYSAIATRLDPEITPDQVRESVELLLRLGLLKKTAWGKYQVENTSLTTGDELRSLALAHFHIKTMDLAKRSIQEHSSQNRDISGITVSISEKMFDRFKKEIQDFRKKLLRLAAEDQNEDRVVQLNMHLFPLTKTGANR